MANGKAAPAASLSSVASDLLQHAPRPLQPLLRELSPRVALAALATGPALWWLWRRWRRAALGTFPEVPGLPLVGALPKGGMDGYVEAAEEWSREHGKDEGVYEVSMLGKRSVVFSSWEACQPVLAGRPFQVTRPSSYAGIGMGQAEETLGLIFSEGRQWSAQRRLVSPAFGAKAVESYLPAACAIVEKLLGCLRLRAAEGRAANVTELLKRMNADIISKVAFGQEFGALDGEPRELDDFKTMLEAMTMRGLSPFPYWKIPFLARWFDSGDEAAGRLDGRLRKFLDDPSATGASTLLGKLMRAEGEKLSHGELVGNVKGLFFAGTDTTSHSLSWALYELSRQPELQEAVAEEVAGLPAGLPGANRLGELPLTRALWLETLRLHSIVPMLDLEVRAPIVVKGRTLPPGTVVCLLFREMCRNSAEYRAALGEDFDAFRPRRWLRPGGGFVECRPLDALAFGQGARACPGKGLANVVGPLVLAEVLRHFRIESWEGPELRERTGSVQCPDRDVELRFVARSG